MHFERGLADHSAEDPVKIEGRQGRLAREHLQIERIIEVSKQCERSRVVRQLGKRSAFPSSRL
jgi:hypothetical protein